MKPYSENLKKPVSDRNFSIGHVLSQNEEIRESVEAAAVNLASVNEILKQEKKAGLPVQILADALVQNKAAEAQVAKAAGDLDQVNTDLAKEVFERTAIESELADMKIDLREARADLSKSIAKEEETQQKAFQDALTGLPNRMLFEQRLEHGLLQAKRHGWKLAVLFIDIDKFKSMNDSYGHDLGDKVLHMVANRLLGFVRGEDTVSRWGGDEFVCILLNIRQETDVALLAEKMACRIAEACEFDETVFCVKVSIGVAIYPGDGETAEILFKKADQAMYQSKGTDRRVVLFSKSASN